MVEKKQKEKKMEDFYFYFVCYEITVTIFQIFIFQNQKIIIKISKKS